MGTGHVMRCLAIAQAWSDGGGNVIFVSKDLPAFLAERLGWNPSTLPLWKCSQQVSMT